MRTSLILILWWLFACYGLIVAQLPTINDEFDAVIPYQGILWVILIILWIWDLFLIPTLITLFENSMLLWIIQLWWTLSKFVLWFVFAYGLLVKYIFTAKTDTKEKITKTYQTLAIVQVPFGIIAILVGLIGIVFNVLY